jgi:hypothetical protein
LTVLDHELARRGLAAPGEVVDALSGDEPHTAAELVALGARLAGLSSLADHPPGDHTPDTHPLAGPTAGDQITVTRT